MIKSRTLRVNILTIFLVLITLTVLSAASYSYFKNYKSIFAFSLGTISRINEMATEKLLCMQNEFNGIIQSTSLLIPDASNILTGNQIFIDYGLNVLKLNNNSSCLYAANENGDLLRLIQFDALSRTYFSEATRPLSKEATYAVQRIQQAENGLHFVNNIQYYDERFTFLSEETLTHIYDPRTQPWYQGVLKNKWLYWTAPYNLIGTNQLGISVANPIIQGDQITGVVGMDWALSTLANFLSSLKLGKTGIACITHSSGAVVEPENPPSKPLIEYAFAEFSKTKSSKFTFKYNGIEYLAGFDILPESFEGEWYISVIIPMNDFFDEFFQTEKEVLLVSLIILIISSILIGYFSKRISSPIVAISNEINKIKNLDFSNETRIHSNILEIKLLDSATAALSSAMRSFSKYLPKEVVRLLLSKGKEIELNGEKKEITILFTDIQGFTTIAETLPTEELMILLAEYFDLLSKIILKNGGTIDKYIGDSIMAFWGAPTDMQDHPFLASQASIACQEAIAELNRERKKNGKPEFPTRMGITTGTAIVGNIGTDQRMNYTVIGDIVNTAARFQNINKIYHTSIIISEELHEKIQGAFLTRPLDIIEVKGKTIKVPIFELMATKQEALCKLFTQAYETYQAKDFARAQALFEEIHQKFPQDFPTQMYLERMKD